MIMQMFIVLCIVMMSVISALAIDLDGGMKFHLPEGASLEVLENGGDFSQYLITTSEINVHVYLGGAPMVGVAEGSAKLVPRFKVPIFVTRTKTERGVVVNVTRVFAQKTFPDPSNVDMSYFYVSLVSEVAEIMVEPVEQELVSLVLKFDYSPPSSEFWEEKWVSPPG